MISHFKCWFQVVLRGLAQVAVADCGVMIVVGSQMAVSSALELISSARRAGADIVVVSLDPPARSLAPGDLVLSHKAEEVLPALSLLLDCPNGPMWGMNRRNVPLARAA